MNAHFYLPRLELGRRESVRQGLSRLATALAEAVSAAARDQTPPAPPRGSKSASAPRIEPAQAIHETRLALKRARALWRLVRPNVGARLVGRENRRLRTAGARLAGARDATVSLRTVEDLAEDAPTEAAEALTGLRQQLDTAAPAGHPTPAAVKRAMRAAGAALTASATALAQAIESVPGSRLLEDGLHDGYRRARRRFRSASATSRASTFHGWRTACKSLLYQVTLLRLAAPQPIGGFLRELDQVQNTLGLEHDLSVLADQLTRFPRRHGGQKALRPVLRLLRSRQQRLRKLALKQSRHLFADRPGRFVSTLQRRWKRWRR